MYECKPVVPIRCPPPLPLWITLVSCCLWLQGKISAKYTCPLHNTVTLKRFHMISYFEGNSFSSNSNQYMPWSVICSYPLPIFSLNYIHHIMAYLLHLPNTPDIPTTFNLTSSPQLDIFSAASVNSCPPLASNAKSTSQNWYSKTSSCGRPFSTHQTKESAWTYWHIVSRPMSTAPTPASMG